MGCGASRDINAEWERPRKSDVKDKSPRLVQFAAGTKGGPSKPRLARAQTGIQLTSTALELEDEEDDDEEVLDFDLPGTAGSTPGARAAAATAGGAP